MMLSRVLKLLFGQSKFNKNIAVIFNCTKKPLSIIQCCGWGQNCNFRILLLRSSGSRSGHMFWIQNTGKNAKLFWLGHTRQITNILLHNAKHYYYIKKGY
jgi:hypothetical protein